MDAHGRLHYHITACVHYFNEGDAPQGVKDQFASTLGYVQDAVMNAALLIDPCNPCEMQGSMTCLMGECPHDNS